MRKASPTKLKEKKTQCNAGKGKKRTCWYKL